MTKPTARKMANDYYRRQRADRLHILLRWTARRVIAYGLGILAYLLVVMK
jgi:hypothetical protein